MHAPKKSPIFWTAASSAVGAEAPASRPPQVLLVVVVELAVDAPPRLIGRNGILPHPAAAGIGIEIDAGIDRPVHRRSRLGVYGSAVKGRRARARSRDLRRPWAQRRRAARRPAAPMAATEEREIVTSVESAGERIGELSRKGVRMTA
jgi:hypothetical protein